MSRSNSVKANLFGYFRAHNVCSIALKNHVVYSGGFDHHLRGWRIRRLGFMRVCRELREEFGKRMEERREVIRS
ncbi:hypothetical protein K435DRAFT_381932 [Dendrothele bispora CBS 962.96]|uniref:Uncharacterized protein n=1 Tax=Dendrothele bispora (strain CBS 962.96) TaxID=1314807 RepID=A0A4S8MVT0_DENBC|nr:hypothetical protein K435DRAFT_381932 [Dendrothele bispora CBS 962.96]